MKLRLHFVIGLLLIFISCSRQNKVIIKGLVNSPVINDMVYIEELRINNNRFIDSVKVRSNGKFRSNLMLKVPGFYQLVFKSGPSLSLILSPGENISITADMADFYKTKQIQGSPSSIRVNTLHDSLRSTIRELNKIRDAFNRIREEDINAKEEQAKLTERFIKIKNDYHRYSIAFILDDLTDLSGIAALYQEYAPDEYVFYSQMDIQFFKLVSDSLIKYYSEVGYVRALRENYLALFNDYNTRRLLQNASPVSYDVPDLNLPGIAGRNLALSSLKGKIVLLTFWSVIQPESIQNTIELKKVYQKYSDQGFEIYQVSVDNSINEWGKIVAFEEIPWVSVCDTGFPDSQTRYFYNVSVLPMNYLIDREQKEILAKNLSPDVLDKNLLRLLNR